MIAHETRWNISAQLFLGSIFLTEIIAQLHKMMAHWGTESIRKNVKYIILNSLTHPHSQVNLNSHKKRKTFFECKQNRPNKQVLLRAVCDYPTSEN